MSMQRIIKALENLGLSHTNAELYVYISKNGPQTEKDLTESFNIDNIYLDSCLEELHTKGLIEKSTEHPSLFFSVGFEKALKLLINSNVKKAKEIIRNKEKLQDNWSKIDSNNNSQKR